MDTISKPKIHNKVNYYKNPFQWGEYPAILQWTHDDNIIIKLKTGTLVCKCNLSEIKKVKIQYNIFMIFYMYDKRKYKIAFPDLQKMVTDQAIESINNGALSDESLNYSRDKILNSPSEHWEAMLRRGGITVVANSDTFMKLTNPTSKQMNIASLVIAILLIIAFVVFEFIL